MAKIESYAPGSFCWRSSRPRMRRPRSNSMATCWLDLVDYPMPAGVFTMFQSDGNDRRRSLSSARRRAHQLGRILSVTDVAASARKSRRWAHKWSWGR